MVFRRRTSNRVASIRWRRRKKGFKAKKRAIMGKLQVPRGLKQSVHFFKRRSMSYFNDGSTSFFTLTDDMKAYQASTQVTLI